MARRSRARHSCCLASKSAALQFPQFLQRKWGAMVAFITGWRDCDRPLLPEELTVTKGGERPFAAT